ncbi:MAG: GTP-binding protein [Nanoarchaeota archaeon]|nr:GTP-binding protein [Nanoarchaeota archaeon]
MPKDDKTSDKIKELEDELRKTKYNKATQHHIGLVKAKLAQLKDKQESRRGVGKSAAGYTIRRSGDATVVLVGFPSVGKSTLLNNLTNAKSKIAAYAFTTLSVIPGLLEYKSAKIQILDVPGVVRGAADGTGRGKEVLSVLRSADFALILVDVHQPNQLKVLQKELYDSHLRINQTKPDVRIKKTPKGGIHVATTVKLTKTTKATIADVMRDFRIVNADVLIREDISVDQLIDIVQGNKEYLPGLVAVNKIDAVDKKRLAQVRKKIGESLLISAEKGTNIEQLKERIFKGLSFIRIYLKQVGKRPDMEEPLIIKEPTTVEDVCRKLHQDFVTKFRFARVWGKSAKFPGQKFRLNHKLLDEDVLELHIS